MIKSPGAPAPLLLPSTQGNFSSLAASAVANPAIARVVAATPAAKLAGARWPAAVSVTTPVVLHWTATTGWHDAVTQPGLAGSDQMISAAAEPGGRVWFGGSASNSAKGTSPLTAEWNGTR